MYLVKSEDIRHQIGKATAYFGLANIGETDDIMREPDIRQACDDFERTENKHSEVRHNSCDVRLADYFTTIQQYLNKSLVDDFVQERFLLPVSDDHTPGQLSTTRKS